LPLLRHKSLGAQVALPVVVALLATTVLVAAFLLWSTRQADTLARERQVRIVASLLDRRMGDMAHDQEASTVWDEAVIMLRQPKLDIDWIDINLGVWFHQYYGHDAVVILKSDGTPVYAMRGGKRTEPTAFADVVNGVMQPLVAELRGKLSRPQDIRLTGRFRSATANDLAVIGGRPAIVSAKPIVPETSAVQQLPGQQDFQVVMRYLDGDFLTELSREYLIDDIRYSSTPAIGAGEAAIPLRSKRAGVIGYLIWKPFAPGSAVLRQLVPALIQALLLVGIAVAILLVRVRRSALEVEASKAQAQHLAFHDALTGLANRALFEDRLDGQVAALRRAGGTDPGIALLYLDLDRFKTVNDTLGHPAGDELIRELARRLAGITRETDTVARLGGDEFAIIQTGVDGPADTEVLCLRIIEEVSQPFQIAGGQIGVGISIGVAFPDADADRIELSRRADIALYHAKSSGRGRFVVFDAAMDAGIRLRGIVEQQLRSALAAGDQFELEYQPVYDALTMRPVAVEALVRWRHPTQGRVSPATFVPIAEETGLIEPLGEWVLRQACLDARDWPVATLAVNVSTVQLRNPAFAATVMTILQETGFDSSRLELEITETSLIEDAPLCQPNISYLRGQGIGFALDDFGTGYSSFAHLREFEVDRLKIDRSFVAGIDGPDGGGAIIRAIVDLAHAGGMAVTAEGVETEEQARHLISVGCQALQGYLLSCPIAPAAISDLLTAKEGNQRSVAA